MLKLLKLWLQAGNLTCPDIFSGLDSNTDIDLARLRKWSATDRKAFSRSILIRHLDAGSSNAEEAELLALSNPYYDISRFGIDFTASPRHADILTISGPVTRHLKVAIERTYQAMPKPNLVVAIGDGACTGKPYEKNFACLGAVDQFLPVDIYIPGDPPSPTEILAGLLKCQSLLAQKELQEVSNP